MSSAGKGLEESVGEMGEDERMEGKIWSQSSGGRWGIGGSVGRPVEVEVGEGDEGLREAGVLVGSLA